MFEFMTVIYQSTIAAIHH